MQLFIVAVVVGGIIAYSIYKARTEQFQTGIMDGGELCIAYKCMDSASGEEFLLKGDALSETMRFAFKKFDGTTRTGRIYTPVFEGEATIFTAHSERSDTVIYERFIVTVNGSKKISFTQETLTEEEYVEAVNGKDGGSK